MKGGEAGYGKCQICFYRHALSLVEGVDVMTVLGCFCIVSNWRG